MIKTLLNLTRTHLLVAMSLISTLSTLAVDFSYEYENNTLNYTISGKTCIVKAGTSTSAGSTIEYSIEGVIIPEVAYYDGTAYPVVGIGSNAFRNAKNLTAITIPGSVLKIDNFAFNGCTALKSVTINAGEEELELGYNSYSSTSQVSSSKGMFYDCPLTKIILRRDITFPGTTNAGYSPFYGKENLSYIIIGNGVTNIPAFTFRNCKITEYNSKPVNNITIPSSVKKIGNYAFYQCNGFNGTLTIPEGVEYIGNYAFNACKGTTEIVLPSTLTTIGSSVFSGNTITKVTSNAVTPPNFGLDAGLLPFSTSIYNAATLYIPEQSINDYKATDSWEPFLKVSGFVIEPTGVSLDEEAISLTVGQSQELVATIEPENSSSKKLTWKSSDETIASVDNSGVVNALAPGNTIITVTTSNGLTAQCTVMVVPGAAAIEGIEADETAVLNVYNLQGMKINASTPGDLRKLHPGIYIVNGKKLLIK